MRPDDGNVCADGKVCATVFLVEFGPALFRIGAAAMFPVLQAAFGDDEHSSAQQGCCAEPAEQSQVVRMTSMKCVVSVAVFVFAVLAVQQSTSAQQSPVPQVPGGGVAVAAQEVPSGFLPSNNSLSKFTQKRTAPAKPAAETFNGFSVQRVAPNYGAPGSAGSGFRHYSSPMERYTNWYRPKAATLTQAQRCEPDAFRPRGMGNLFNRPYDGFRMDYEPYAIGDAASTYGPAYILGAPDPRCAPECCLEERCDHCKQCDKGSHRH